MTSKRTILAALFLVTAGCATAGPRTVAPRHINRDHFEQLIEREYPPLLRNAGIGGVTRILLKLDYEGIVEDVSIMESSGHQELDTAALLVAREMRFTPYRIDGEPAPAQISFTVTFSAR